MHPMKSVCLKRAGVLLILFGAVASAHAISSADFAFRTVAGDGGNGLQLPYRIYVPAACASRRCGLVVFLHGAGETGSNNLAQLGNRANGAFQIAEFAEAAGQPVLLAAPQTPAWWGNDNPSAGVADMLDDIQREFGFDPARLYVTGLSMGGAGTIGFLQRYDASAAAAAVICPAGELSSSIDGERFASTPLWFFHALDDGVVPVARSRNSIAALRAAGGDPIYTQYQTGGHSIFSQSYSNPRLTGWLLAQRWRAPAQGVDPLLTLSQPTAAAVLYTAATSLSVLGSVVGSNPQVSAVNYSFGAASGAAVGTTNFSAGPLAVPASAQTLLRVQATGSSHIAALGGVSTYSRTLRVVTPVPANRAPSATLWAEPVLRVGDSLRLRALVDDDGQPNAIPQISFELLSAPVMDAIDVDPLQPALAWFTPSAPGLYRFRLRASDGALQTFSSADVLVLAAAGARPTVAAINAGGPALLAGNGVSFAADAGFTGGASETLTGVTTIYASEDDVLHRTMRRGNGFGYATAVPNGRYLVVLYLSEWRWFTLVSRNMDVQLEGQSILSNFNLYRWAGLRQAMRLGFALDVTDGVLNIDLARGAGATTDPRIDAFEILAAPLDDAIFRSGFDG